MASILFVASEGLPFIKTGGLADVVGSLPLSLTDRGHEVKVVMPLYKKIADKFLDTFEFVGEYSVSINYQEVPVRLFTSTVKNVQYYFIQHQGYFERDTLYGYNDDGERFAYFQKAVIEMLNQVDYWPEVVHCHDWHTGMIPCMVKEVHYKDQRYRGIRFVYTIHNLAFQGNFGVDILDSCLGLPYYLFENGNVRFDGGISYMKSGILYADKVTTVSPNYAKEILTEQYGERLESVLSMRKYDLWGIVNGIDVELWNPKTDPEIPYHFDKVNVAVEKTKCKLALQKEMGLEENGNVMLVGVVSRLTIQKGFYLMMEQLNAICAANIQLVILGSGESAIETKFRQLEDGNKGKIAFYQGYNEALAHRIYAGCDLFLMPSLFEPCGLSQLCSLRYGTLPLVRETGGLKDTVQPYNQYDKTGNGFSFTNYNSQDMVNTLNLAIDVYYNRPEDWRILRDTALTSDVSWDASAVIYNQLYEELLG
ncbi:MAG: glycogen synthase GlgA [Bacillota bacterium]|nr:glycogen synthase GlgA [Bacillota bacterium]